MKIHDNEMHSFNELFATCALKELGRKGVEDVFIAPGSRSAPLTLAAANNPKFRTHLHYDERGLGFFALGCAKRSKKPTLVITTSGTATANLYPAVVEAFESETPLILLTADRPVELINCGANQAIDQRNLYGSFVIESYDLSPPEDIPLLEELVTTIGNAYDRSREGPVHINWRFREPLVPPARINFKTSRGEFPSMRLGRGTGVLCRGGGLPLRSRLSEGNSPKQRGFEIDSSELKPVEALISASKRGVILIGQSIDPAGIDELSQKLRWPIFADIQYRYAAKSDTRIFHFDAFLEELAPPDCVLHFGGRLTSKKIEPWISQAEYLQVTSTERCQDPTHREKRLLIGSIKQFSDSISPLSQESSLLAEAKGLSRKYGAFLSEQFELSTTLSEPLVSSLISKALPDHANLFLGSSLPIREMDRFGVERREELEVYANRGASGIDGNIATFAGIALGSAKPSLALLGDLTALHDLNSLPLLKGSSAPTVLVILNNDGGGIFSFLTVAGHPHFEKYFGTPHGFSFASFAEGFGFDYFNPKGAADFSEILHTALQKNRVSVIEVDFHREQTLACYRAIEGAWKAKR